jgi:hypothetical protein
MRDSFLGLIMLQIAAVVALNLRSDQSGSDSSSDDTYLSLTSSAAKQWHVGQGDESNMERPRILERRKAVGLGTSTRPSLLLSKPDDPLGASTRKTLLLTEQGDAAEEHTKKELARHGPRAGAWTLYEAELLGPKENDALDDVQGESDTLQQFTLSQLVRRAHAREMGKDSKSRQGSTPSPRQESNDNKVLDRSNLRALIRMVWTLFKWIVARGTEVGFKMYFKQTFEIRSNRISRKNVFLSKSF